MSDAKGTWLPAHEEFLRKKVARGASNKVISTEFAFLPRGGEPAFLPSEQDIARKREELDLPPENGSIAASANVVASRIPFKGPEFSDEIKTKPSIIKIKTSEAIMPADHEDGKPLSASKVQQKSKPPKKGRINKKAKPTPTEDFEAVAAEEIKQEDNSSEPIVKLPEFEPKVPGSYKVGKKYYHPVRGLVEYAGITKTETSVGTFEVMKFNGKEPVQVPPSKVAAQNIRMLADATFMDSVLKGIADASLKGKRPVGRGEMQIKECRARLTSGNPVKLASLVYWAFRAPVDKRINPIHGDMAITKLAEEYAVIKNMDFDKAKKLFLEKSRRPTGADIFTNTESPKYHSRNKHEPS